MCLTKHARVAFAAIALAFLAGCNAESQLASETVFNGGLWTVRLTSPAFLDAEQMPAKYTQRGGNVSPPLSWTKGPSGVKQWVLIVQDVSGGKPVNHWLVYNIPPKVTEMPENAARDYELTQGANYLGRHDWAGPSPRGGEAHHYYFEIFALDTAIAATADMDPRAIAHELKRQNGNVLAKGQLVGIYREPEKKK